MSLRIKTLKIEVWPLKSFISHFERQPRPKAVPPFNPASHPSMIFFRPRWRPQERRRLGRLRRGVGGGCGKKTLDGRAGGAGQIKNGQNPSENIQNCHPLPPTKKQIRKLDIREIHYPRNGYLSVPYCLPFNIILEMARASPRTRHVYSIACHQEPANSAHEVHPRMVITYAKMSAKDRDELQMSRMYSGKL